MQKILLTLFLLTALVFSNTPAYAADACIPGVHDPNSGSYSDEPSPDDCPAETICYVTIGPTARCYIPAGAPANPTDPTGGFTPVRAEDTCTGLESITFNPNPAKAKIEFIVSGSLTDCPNIAAQAIFIDLENIDTGVKRSGVRDVRTDASGNFTLDKFVISEPGQWKLKFRYNLKDRIIDSPNAIISVEESDKKEFVCGDRVENADSVCPEECPNSQVGDIRKCGPTTSNPVLEGICADQGETNVDFTKLAACQGGTLTFRDRVPAFKCSNDRNSYVCPEPTYTLCREDDDTVSCGDRFVAGFAGGVPCNPTTGQISPEPPTKAQIAKEMGFTPRSPEWNLIVYGGYNPATLGTAAIKAADIKLKTDELNKRYNETLAKLPRGMMTAIGCIPSEPKALVEGLLKYGSFAAGAVAFIIMIIAALQMITAEGNPESIKGAQEKFYSAIIGLLLIIFSVLLLQFIGVDILGLPALTR